MSGLWTRCKLYKMRWQVETFFKWIKQRLKIKHVIGNSLNGDPPFLPAGGQPGSIIRLLYYY